MDATTFTYNSLSLMGVKFNGFTLQLAVIIHRSIISLSRWSSDAYTATTCPHLEYYYKKSYLFT